MWMHDIGSGMNPIFRIVREQILASIAHKMHNMKDRYDSTQS